MAVCLKGDIRRRMPAYFCDLLDRASAIDQIGYKRMPEIMDSDVMDSGYFFELVFNNFGGSVRKRSCQK